MLFYPGLVGLVPGPVFPAPVWRLSGIENASFIRFFREQPECFYMCFHPSLDDVFCN